MNARVKKGIYIAKEVISWVLLIAVFCVFVFTVYNTFVNKDKAEGAFLFGYRPVLVLTGSMEPYMMTNGLALTKEVTDICELSVGDVVTYHVQGQEGNMLRITHRIIDISGNFIYTKGDNNSVSDCYALTIDNIEAKVVGVTNITAWIAAKWQTTAGKIMLISFALGAILLYFCLKMGIDYLRQKRKGTNAEATDENIIDAEGATVIEEVPAGEPIPQEVQPEEPTAEAAPEAPPEEAAPAEAEAVQEEKPEC